MRDRKVGTCHVAHHGNHLKNVLPMASSLKVSGVGEVAQSGCQHNYREWYYWDRKAAVKESQDITNL